MHFHEKLTQGLTSVERRTTPSPPQPLPWPAHTIRVRVSDPPFDPNETYIIGQGRIADAHRGAMQNLLSPADLAREPRKRLFIVGESAAFGYPYAIESSLAHLLQQRLDDRYAVINAAQVSWSSADLRALVQRIVDEYRPDVIVLFLGNNEWQHWDGLGRASVVNRHVALLRTLSRSRLLSGAIWLSLKRAVVRSTEADAVPGEFSPKHELTGYRYALDHPAERHASVDPGEWQRVKRSFADAFGRNLRHMIDVARSQGVRVILVKSPINHRLSPAWSHPQWESTNAATAARTGSALRDAVRRLEASDFTSALQTIDRAVALDAGPSILHYVRAEALRELGRGREAEQAYLASRERMVGHLGTPLTFHRVIDESARERSLERLDAQALFEEYTHEAGGHFNELLILDDCHPTPLGHRIIADRLAAMLH